MNYLSMAKKENIQELLNLYIFDSEKDKSTVLANRKRVQGIEDVEVKQVSKIVRGLLIRGQEINVKLRLDNFTSLGDLYLFGMVLNYYFGVYCSFNTFVKLKVSDIRSGEVFTWKERQGERLVI